MEINIENKTEIIYNMKYKSNFDHGIDSKKNPQNNDINAQTMSIISNKLNINENTQIQFKYIKRNINKYGYSELNVISELLNNYQIL